MTQRERIEKLNPTQRELLVEQLQARNVLKLKQGRYQTQDKCAMVSLPLIRGRIPFC